MPEMAGGHGLNEDQPIDIRKTLVSHHFVHDLIWEIGFMQQDQQCRTSAPFVTSFVTTRIVVCCSGLQLHFSVNMGLKMKAPTGM